MRDVKIQGAKLRELRGDKPLHIIAKKLGVSMSALAMYERGERVPRDATKIKIAAFYKKSVQELFYT